jgi:predicted methyltransferase
VLKLADQIKVIVAEMLERRVKDPRLLPVTGKVALMDRFDDWVTDPAATLQRVQAFVADGCAQHVEVACDIGGGHLRLGVCDRLRGTRRGALPR